MNYVKMVQLPSFFYFLLQLDLSIVAATRKLGCRYCGNAIHRSDWQRAGFGLPPGCSEEVFRRHSFVCGSCKRRNTPNSLRWMYYGWYSSCVRLLASALVKRGDRSARIKLCESMDISQNLLCRWRKWWRESFLKSGFWQSCRGRFGFIDPNNIAEALFDYFVDLYRAKNPVRIILRKVVDFLSLFRSERLRQKNCAACEKLWLDHRYRQDFGLMTNKN